MVPLAGVPLGLAHVDYRQALGSIECGIVQGRRPTHVTLQVPFDDIRHRRSLGGTEGRRIDSLGRTPVLEFNLHYRANERLIELAAL